MANLLAKPGKETRPKGECGHVCQTQKLQVWLSILVNVSGKDTGMFCLVTIEDLIGKNLIIDWEYCFGCNGYAREGVHSFCLFTKYDYNNPRSRELIFNIDTTDASIDIGFRGKVVSTYWLKGKEHIQVRITQIEDETYDLIANALQVK